MRVFTLLTFALVGSWGTGSAAEKIRASSFSTILTEITEQIGGDRVTVHAHVKPGVDPHDFQPTPEDLRIVSDAQLILLSAKHMEGYVNKLKESTGTQGRVLEVGDQLPSLKATAGHEHQHGSKQAAHHEAEDPHWWHSIANVQRATKLVRDELIKLNPEDKAAFETNAEHHLRKLDALSKWAKREIARLPRNKRKLVTSHDSFQYFAKEHGFSVYAVEGISSADQPSSKKVADLIKTVKAQGVKAVFAEKIENPKVLQEITRETGAVIGGELYADGLGEGEAATYDGMYRHNVATIVKSLL